MNRIMATATPAPPLKNADRLRAVEFMRRYEAMPELKKAELIEGVVHVGGPVRFTTHAEPHAHLVTWLGHFTVAARALLLGSPCTVRLDDQNVYQPDAVLFIDPAHGGQARIVDGFIEGGAELVGEVSDETVCLDLGAKLHGYRRLGVREYMVWRTIDGAVDWFTLRDGEYVPTPPGEDGLIRSETFPGLWLDPVALIASDLARVLAVVGEGVKSAEHAGFVARLNG